MSRNWMLLLGLVGTPLSCMGGLAEKVDEVTQKVVSSLDRAIDSINAQSNNWQTVLTELAADLPADVQSTVTHEVSALLQRGIAATGAQVRCDTDFFANRMKQGLLSIKLAFLGGSPLPVEPRLCDVVPLAVDLNLEPERRNKIELYGYDFDQTQIQVAMETSSGETDVTRFLDQPTHYHLTLNLGAGGVQIPADARRFTLRWDGRTISTIALVQPTPDLCESRPLDAPLATVGLMPRKTRGDAEYDGSGPAVFASIHLHNRGDRVDAILTMKATETESDWSTAEETRTFSVFQPDPGWTVHRIVSPAEASYSYTDNDHGPDDFAGSGPVKTWKFTGDGDGDDIGRHTRVEVDFNVLKIELKENRDCVPTSTLRLLESLQQLSPLTLEKAEREFPQFRHVLQPR